MKKVMWKTMLAVGITLVSLEVVAKKITPPECGTYEIKGFLRKHDGKTVLKMYENSQSETILTMDTDLEELAVLNIDRAVVIKGRLDSPVKFHKGHIKSLLSKEDIKKLQASDRPYIDRFMREDIQERVPDPLHPDLDSSMTLVTSSRCY